MVVPSKVIQVHFQNALPLSVEDFNALLKNIKFAGKLVCSCIIARGKSLSFLIMLRSVIHSISHSEKKKMSNCIMGGKNPTQNQQTNKQTNKQKILLLKAYQHLQNSCLFSLDQNKVNLKMPVSAWQNLVIGVITTWCKINVYYGFYFFFRGFEGTSCFSHTFYHHQTASCQITHFPSLCNELQSATLQSGSTWRWSAGFPELIGSSSFLQRDGGGEGISIPWRLQNCKSF